MKRLTVLTAALFEAGCQTVTVVSGCPPLVEYSRTQQQQAAIEMKKNAGTQLAKMIADYSKLRDACRVDGK